MQHNAKRTVQKRKRNTRKCTTTTHANKQKQTANQGHAQQETQKRKCNTRHANKGVATTGMQTHEMQEKI